MRRAVMYKGLAAGPPPSSKPQCRPQRILAIDGFDDTTTSGLQSAAAVEGNSGEGRYQLGGRGHARGRGASNLEPPS